MARNRSTSPRRAREIRGLLAACVVLGLATTFAGIAAQSSGTSPNYASWQARAGIVSDTLTASGPAETRKASPAAAPAGVL
jgi:hypothetical protein